MDPLLNNPSIGHGMINNIDLNIDMVIDESDVMDVEYKLSRKRKRENESDFFQPPSSKKICMSTWHWTIHPFWLCVTQSVSADYKVEEKLSFKRKWDYEPTLRDRDAAFGPRRKRFHVGTCEKQPPLGVALLNVCL